MIAPAFLIKILGCATVGAFVTIGIPVIVANENERKAEETRRLAEATKVEAENTKKLEEKAAENTKKVEAAAVKAQVQKRQAEIDKPATLSQFFSNLLASTLDGTTKPASEIKEGETFSDAAFTDSWKLKDDEKTAIATNWSETIEKMPNAFFIKLQDKSLTQGAGVCHIHTYRTKFNDKKIKLYIPFLESKIKTIGNKLSSVSNKSGQIEMTGRSAQSKQQLTSTTSTTSTSTAITQDEATDLLFLQELYEETIARLVALGNNIEESGNSGYIWDVR